MSTKQEAEEETQIASRAKDVALAFVIEDAESYRVAVETLRELANKAKEIDTKRKSATRPLDDAKKEIISWWQPAVDRISEASVSLRRAIVEYDAKQQEREQAVARAAAAALVAGKPVDTAAMAAVFAQEKPAGIAIKKVWRFRITDFDALPNEYKVANDTKIGAVVRALKSDTKIPGVEAFEEHQAALTGRE